MKDRPRTGRPKDATNEEKSLDVLLSIVENPHSSLSRLGQANDISKVSSFRILKNNRFHPYKIFVTQDLVEEDCNRRIELCDEMIARHDRDPFLIL